MSKRHLWNHKHPSPMHAMKPPYNGGRAQRMGWPCEPPYQMKWAKKCRWRADWRRAARVSSMSWPVTGKQGIVRIDGP